jgi:DNA-binding response OmpR family regulator
MANLRSKIELDSARPAMILTETGVGYRFNEETVK